MSVCVYTYICTCSSKSDYRKEARVTIDYESDSETYDIRIRFNPEAYGIEVQNRTAMTDDARGKLSNNKDIPTRTYATEIFFSCAVPCSKSLLSSL